VQPHCDYLSAIIEDVLSGENTSCWRSSNLVSSVLSVPQGALEIDLARTKLTAAT